MTIIYNLTGVERKALVAAIGRLLDKPAVYAGVPTFAYTIGAYNVSQYGTLTGPDNTGLVYALWQNGFTAEGCGDYEVALYAEQEMQRMRIENKNIPDYSNHGLYSGDSIDMPEPVSDKLAIEVPTTGFSGQARVNLGKIIASRKSVIQRAFGIDSLPVETTEEVLCFSWFTLTGADGEVDAYTRFILALCNMAKRQKRVTAKDRDTGNDKFTMRLFLIRLGFVGSEYKTARRILMRNLTGSSSWKNGQPPESSRKRERVGVHYGKE